MILPWQSSQWQQLWQAYTAGRLAHGLLFTGVSGTGKTQFAHAFATTLLCEKKDTTVNPAAMKACGECHACRLMVNRAHPNALWIEPEKTGQAIKVDQIRVISDFVNHTSLQGQYRIVIVNPAGNMNLSAANALLKTLEEPSQNAIIVLIGDVSARLPATIVSRCQRIVFPAPNREQGLAWLRSQPINDKTNLPLLLSLVNNAPLAVADLIDSEKLAFRTLLYDYLSSPSADPIKAAASLQELGVLPTIDFCLSWLQDLMKLQASADTEISNQDYSEQLSALKDKTPMAAHSALVSYLLALRAQVLAGVNLNKQLFLENLFIRFAAQN